MLVEMLKQSQDFLKLTPPEQAITLSLAHTFQERTDYLFLNPEELVDMTEIGTKDQWQELLNRQETQSYIKSTMAFLAQISQRKTFKSLVEMALSGNQGAAKQVTELSGVLNSTDNNKIIILHKIPRPEEKGETNV